jgi:hypothetical protein
MELVQFVYRGRGHGGDARRRRIEVVAIDALDEAPGEDRLDLARRHADLCAFLLTVRAALHTRISGAYQHPAGPLAVMPLGRSGAEARPWHLQQVLSDIAVSSVQYGTDPIVLALGSAARALLGSIQYRGARLPSTVATPARSLVEAVPLLAEGARAVGPLLVLACSLSDVAIASEAESRAALRALARFFARDRAAQTYSMPLVRAAQALNEICRDLGAARGRQEIAGRPFRARVIVPIAARDVAASLQRVAPGDEPEHARWAAALSGWAALSSGMGAAATGGQSHRFDGVPFTVVVDDLDPTGLDDLGRREVVRGGIVLNALAGIVLHQAPPGSQPSPELSDPSVTEPKVVQITLPVLTSPDISGEACGETEERIAEARRTD